jgi:hypothetical protein
MILRSNLPKLREVGVRSARVLDAVGWYRPFNLATQRQPMVLSEAKNRTTVHG